VLSFGSIRFGKLNVNVQMIVPQKLEFATSRALLGNHGCGLAIRWLLNGLWFGVKENDARVLEYVELHE
jgi:hypothetical protein